MAKHFVDIVVSNSTAASLNLYDADGELVETIYSLDPRQIEDLRRSCDRALDMLQS